VSIEEKAKAEAKKLIAEVSQLQAKARSQTQASQVETQRLMMEISKLQAAAVKERSSEKARQAQSETKRLMSEQLSHLTDRQQNTREQLDRLLQAKQKYDFAIKNNNADANSKDVQLHQQLLLMIKKKKEEFVQCNKEIEELKLQAQKQSVSLDDIFKSQRESAANVANTQTTSISKPKENPAISVAERAKAEAEKLIKEVTKNRVSDTTTKAQEVSKMIEEISRLQMSADQGTLSESEAKQLEDRVKKIEEKQRGAREQINQLTQAKIKYELALAKSVEERSKENARREQDEKLRGELNSLIKAKEEEQRKLLEELETIRLRSEQEAALLKTQRDAARALAEQQAETDKLNKTVRKRGLSKNKMMLGVVLLVITMGGGVAGFFMMPKVNEWNDSRQKNDTAQTAQVSAEKAEKSPKKAEKPEKIEPEEPKAVAMKAVRTFRDKLTSGGRAPEMVQLPAGTFWMGVPSTQPYGDERPQFEVNLESFSIGKYEVTVEEYRAFANATGRKIPEGSEQANHPIMNVTWEDANAYADWLSKETNAQYRLPSEREWEYAARAGTLTAYHWGNELGSNHANCNGCGSQWDGQQIAPVGSFAANTFGLHDMIGNVLEWTRTCYRPSYEGAPASGQDWEGGNCAQRMVRGSGFNTYPKETRVTKRKFLTPKSFSNNLGFRVTRINS
jgi:formylglycine-generating enzyme required for sulfatase activity